MNVGLRIVQTASLSVSLANIVMQFIVKVAATISWIYARVRVVKEETAAMETVLMIMTMMQIVL